MAISIIMQSCEENLLEKGNVKSVHEFYRSIFDQCDVNKDGHISMSELRKFIVEAEDKITDPVLVNICKIADKNQDGRIDFTEFVELINNPRFRYIFGRYASRYIKLVVAPHNNKLLRRTTVTGLYEEEYMCKWHTIFMISLSVIQLTVFYVDKALRENLQTNNTSIEMGPIEEALRFDPNHKHEIWRFFTYMFIHANELHLFPNILIQLIIGLPLEMVHSWRVLVIYAAGVLGGSLATSVIEPRSSLVGGSAGVYSFYTAHIATVIMNWREMSYPCAQLILFGLLTIFDPIYNYLLTQTNTESSSVSYVAHLAGAVAGLLVGVNIIRNLRVTRMETIVWWIFSVVFGLLVSILVIINLANFTGDSLEYVAVNSVANMTDPN